MNTIAESGGEERKGKVSVASPDLLRVLDVRGLTSLGIGGIIGTGIFVIAGQAAKEVAGPAVILSFLIAALACGCAALCYATLASRFPQAGSAYAYGRALLAPFPAFLIGWNLLLQYTLAAASIAQGWSHYFQDALIALFGTVATLPSLLRGAPGSSPGALLDLSAFCIVIALLLLLLRGISPSLRVNHVIVVLKLLVVFLILAVGVFYINPANWIPFAPFGWGGLQLPFVAGSGPPQGMLAGAALVIYAYLGFESLTNYSEEARMPQRDVPRSIFQSLSICTLLYMAMAVVLTGMVRYDLLSRDAPVSEAFGQVGLPWVRTVVALGALAGITSVLLVILLSLPRIMMAVSRDGILNRDFLSRIAANGVPVNATRTGGIVIALLTAFVPLDALGVVAVMTNMVTFIAVALLAMRLPRQNGSETGTRFRSTDIVAPLITIFMSVVLLLSLPWFGWIVMAFWWLCGGVLYMLRWRKAQT